MPIFTIKKDGKRCRVKLLGDLIVEHVPELQQALKSALDGEVIELEVDFGAAQMLDSSGIGLLIAYSNSLAAKNGSVHLINVPAEILGLLKMMRLAGRFNAKGK